MMNIELTAEYLRGVRFQMRRGNAYDAAEVDAFMDALIAKIEELESLEGDLPHVMRLEAVCEIRAEMTERIMRELLEAEKKLAPLLKQDENY